MRLNKNTYIADLDPFENIYISLDMLDQKAIEVLSDICPDCDIQLDFEIA